MSDGEGDGNEGDRADERSESTDQQIRGESDVLDRVLKILTERQRRYVLYYLREREVCEVDDLARYIAGIKAESSAVDESDFQETKIQLVHKDLPAVTDAGFVEYNGRSETIRYSEPQPVLEKLLEITAEIDEPDDPTDDS